jgi:glycosyltransferase involved in cell wall biosynthesis
MAAGLRVLHAIHDFLPRHLAGSEIYAYELARQLARRHQVTVVCAEFDPARRHGTVTWKLVENLAVVEVANNWVCRTFAETYEPPLITEHLVHVLDAVDPDVVHVHNLLNLSFALPRLARARGAAVVATLHDYTLVCASGGQRVHVAEHHQCDTIDTDRCARCFRESPFARQMSFGRVTTGAPSRARAAAATALRSIPGVARALATGAERALGPPVTAAGIEARLASARRVFEDIDLFVAPSSSIADEYSLLGVDRTKIVVSDYGFASAITGRRRTGGDGVVRFGYVGTIIWHKGVHMILEAVRDLPADAYEVHVFGDPQVSPEYVAHLRARADGLPITFRGPFTRESMADVYADIDVLVVPSLWLENSPLVIHEAYMAGVPVVGARIGGVPGLVAEGVNGWLYRHDSHDDLARALREVLDRPDRIAEFRQRLPAVKSIERDAADWEARYRDVLDRRAAALVV